MQAVSLLSETCATIVWHFTGCHIQVPVELHHLYLLTVEGDICQWLLAPSEIKTCSSLCRVLSRLLCFPHCSVRCIPQDRKPRKKSNTHTHKKRNNNKKQKHRWIWNQRCKEWTGNVKEMFHGVLLCSMSKTLCQRQKHPPVCRVCDAGIVHLHHTEPLAELNGGRGMLKAVKMSRKHDPGCSRWDVLQFAPATFSRVRCSQTDLSKVWEKPVWLACCHVGAAWKMARERSRVQQCWPGCCSVSC